MNINKSTEIIKITTTILPSHVFTNITDPNYIINIKTCADYLKIKLSTKTILKSDITNIKMFLFNYYYNNPEIYSTHPVNYENRWLNSNVQEWLDLTFNRYLNLIVSELEKSTNVMFSLYFPFNTFKYFIEFLESKNIRYVLENNLKITHIPYYREKNINFIINIGVDDHFGIENHKLNHILDFDLCELIEDYMDTLPIEKVSLRSFKHFYDKNTEICVGKELYKNLCINIPELDNLLRNMIEAPYLHFKKEYDNIFLAKYKDTKRYAFLANIIQTQTIVDDVEWRSKSKGNYQYYVANMFSDNIFDNYNKISAILSYSKILDTISPFLYQDINPNIFANLYLDKKILPKLEKLPQFSRWFCQAITCGDLKIIRNNHKNIYRANFLKFSSIFKYEELEYLQQIDVAQRIINKIDVSLWDLYSFSISLSKFVDIVPDKIVRTSLKKNHYDYSDFITDLACSYEMFVSNIMYKESYFDVVEKIVNNNPFIIINCKQFKKMCLKIGYFSNKLVKYLVENKIVKMRNNELVRRIGERNSIIIKYCHKYRKVIDDKDLIYILEIDPTYFMYVTYKTSDIISRVLEIDGDMLQYVKQKPEYCLIAVKQNAKAYLHINKKFITDDFIEKLIKVNPSIKEYINLASCQCPRKCDSLNNNNNNNNTLDIQKFVSYFGDINLI